MPQQLNEVEVYYFFFFNTKVLTKLEAKVLAKLEAKVLTKNEAEHDGSVMEEGLPLDEQHNEMPNKPAEVPKQLD